MTVDVILEDHIWYMSIVHFISEVRRSTKTITLYIISLVDKKNLKDKELPKTYELSLPVNTLNTLFDLVCQLL